MDVNGSLEQCLAVIKRFLLCPVCLDDFRNPAITPCAHIFCKFCINEHIGKKRHASCPLCMKTFTRRSLKYSGKLNEITVSCRELLATYEEESGVALKPSSVPDDFLHLSQELTQYQTSSNNQYSAFIPAKENVPASAKKFKTVYGAAKNTARSSRILLGTAACVRRSQQRKDNADDSSLLTQPMVYDSSMLPNASGSELSPIKSHCDLADLFTSTQATQPMLEDSEFTPVLGLRENVSSRGEHVNTSHVFQLSETNVTAPSRSRYKGIRTVPSRPPIPPRDQLHTRRKNFSPESKEKPSGAVPSYEKRTSQPSSMVRPRKQIRRESSHSTLSSAHGVLTKTHEVFCQINLADKQTVDTADDTVRTEVRSLYGTGLKRLPSKTSVSSWPLKRSRMQLSLETRNQLLRKYNLTRQSLSFKKSIKGRSVLSPGWSRWRSMCHELKRRGSALSLSIRTDRKSKGKVNTDADHWHSNSVTTNTDARSVHLNPKNSANSGSFLHRISDTVLRRSKRDRVRLEVVKTIVPETQDFPVNLTEERSDTCVVGETPISPQRTPLESFTSRVNSKYEPCQFVIPLRRIVPRTLSSSCNRRASDTGHCPSTGILVDLPRRSCESDVDLLSHVKSPENPVRITIDKSGAIHPSTRNGNCRVLHCSACGESLFIQPTSLSTPCGSPSKTAARTASLISAEELSCSISSTYWQAEDPCDSALSGFHTDHLVSLNRTAAASVSLFNEVGCQTSMDLLEKTQCNQSEAPETLKSVTNPKTLFKDDELDRKISTRPQASGCSGIDVADNVAAHVASLPSPKPRRSFQSFVRASPVQFSTEKQVCHPTASTVDSCNSPRSSAIDSTFQPCSSDIIPTVDRERLRNECNELEAVVAALQQQLEAQTAQLTPKATEELLRTAGTEACDDEMEVYSRIVSSDGRSSKLANIDDLPAPSDTHAILESSAPEPVDVIPSSQADDELDTVEKPANEGNKLPGNISVSPSLAAVPRVEASQPPSSLGTVVLGVIPTPLALHASREPGGPICPERTLTRTNRNELTTVDLTECPETDLDGLSHRPQDLTVQCTLQDPRSSRFSHSTLMVTGSNLMGGGGVCRRFFFRIL
ncbi:hypothetical protein D915_002605 [Fasciola hepatica]|uniref:RING-type domain-containing protein n=1 Tax=Fasciola hepatica TaxID=6192 RepID=A0A4E0RHG1_FASHE|nr:hypothetical protein D915_002605 [Fasciola hepatica]